MKDKINITYLKGMLYSELLQLDEAKARLAKLRYEIECLEHIVEMLNKHDYDVIYKEYEFISTYFNKFLSAGKERIEAQKKELFTSVYFCKLYNNNPDRYQEVDFRKNKKIVDKYAKNLQETLNIRKGEYLLNENVAAEDLVKTYSHIIYNFKFNRPITAEQYEVLKRLFISKNMTGPQITLALSCVSSHNVRCKRKEKGLSFDPNIANRITNMLSCGFEIIEVPWCESPRKKQIDALINEITRFYHDGEVEGLNTMLPFYKGNLIFSDAYTLDEFIYFINSLLKHYQDLMFTDIKELNDRENYGDRDCRNMLADEFDGARKVYRIINDHADSQYERYQEDLTKTMNEKEDVNILYYASGAEGSRPYLENDLKGMPNDLYLRILNLIMRFKKGECYHDETRQLMDLGSGAMELRDDQIRILLRSLGNNQYIMLGCVHKKTNAAFKTLQKVYDRNVGALLPAVDAEAIIFEKLQSGMHRGGRGAS